MDKSTVIAKPRECEAELQGSGIVHLSLFGSKARGDDSPLSDVDLMADFDRARKLSLIGRVHLENLLTDILGVKADLSDRRMVLNSVSYPRLSAFIRVHPRLIILLRHCFNGHKYWPPMNTDKRG